MRLARSSGPLPEQQPPAIFARESETTGRLAMQDSRMSCDGIVPPKGRLVPQSAEEYTSYHPKMDNLVLNSPRLTHCAACKALYKCV